jgi:hypothetical protein
MWHRCSGGGPVTLVIPSSVAVAEKEEVVTAIAKETKSVETKRVAVHNMDAMAFGIMGCCCLQITFQAMDVDESRFIYDQLAVMAPM